VLRGLGAGLEEVSLVSLETDHTQIVDRSTRRRPLCPARAVAFSTRPDNMPVEVARRGAAKGITLAPEAGSQRMRT
jgi:hypothetical protein